ncbi:hypothetical protein C3747_80g120 [Trypanosoma cruzi]|uniref:Uncharacterized protein n=1 Tax=Trypanosoma cruzi TaxID=5693 RepID=A0A2V2WLC5_TRYCR|nr:hypothetical protein ECC02_007654 [Trypanosoma cruzi]KAF5219321.1 hypothetical protein ECC02_007657 [Trypanosoma cruzi]PWV09376.1 hypothetical protein C3747_80g114 [Trypanosoma cruzi]PWV09381.1 hypothetical protein C3747_80g120 [Trypanosoma cruzi]
MPLLLRPRLRGERIRMQFVFGCCGVSRKEACDAAARRASEPAQLTDTWTAVMVALAKRIIFARRHKPETRRTTITGDREPTHTDTTLACEEEAALARFCTNTDGCYDHRDPPYHARAVGAARMSRNRNAKNFARKPLLIPLDPAPSRRKAPAECPACGKQYSLRTGDAESQVPRCAGTAWNPTGTTTRHFSKDGDERRQTDRTSATDCTAQTAAIPMQSLLGVVQPKSPTHSSPPAPPHARPLRATNKAFPGI